MEPEELDKFIIRALEAGNRTWIADYIRGGGNLNTPRLRKLFLDLVEKKWRWPPHRVRKFETSWRHLAIAAFVCRHLDEQKRKGKTKPSPEDARDAAHKHFGLSRSTVRDAYDRYCELCSKWDPRLLTFAAGGFESDSFPPPGFENIHVLLTGEIVWTGECEPSPAPTKKSDTSL
jgi:hypothetical protein